VSSRIDRNVSGRIGFLVAYVLPWPFLLAGIVVFGIGLHNLRNAQASEHWPTTAGTVVSSAVRTSSGQSSSANEPSRTDITYHAKISYQYHVEGTAHMGTRVAYGDCGSSRSSRAHDIVDRYPKGATVKVFYSPESPAESVLEPGTEPQAFFLPAVGSVFVLAGLGMVVGLPAAARRAIRHRPCKVAEAEG
jgi:hypothetical protein